MGTTSSRFLTKNIESLIGLGLTESALMDVVPGGRAALEDPLKRFDGRVLVDIFQIAETVTKDPAIGFRCGLNHGNVTYNDIAFTILYCKNLGDGFKLSERFEPLAQTYGLNKLVIDENIAHIHWVTEEEAPKKLRHVSDLSFATLARLGLWIKAVHGLSVKKMQLRHENEDYKDLYLSFFDCPIEYGAKQDVLSFDKAFLDVKLPGHNPKILALLTARLEHDLSLLDQDISESEAVKAYIRKVLGEEPCTISNISEKMNLPEWRLRRLLKEQKTSFREILENVRRDRYEILRQQGTYSQVQIAGELGYSEQSAFSRAYKKWYGSAPVRPR